MQTVFRIENKPHYPATLKDYVDSDNGYIYAEIRVLECSVKRYKGRIVKFSGVLPSYASYFKYSGKMRIDAKNNFVPCTGDALVCSLVHPEYFTLKDLRAINQEMEVRGCSQEAVEELNGYVQGLNCNEIPVDNIPDGLINKGKVDFYRVERELPIMNTFASKQKKMIKIQTRLRKMDLDSIRQLENLLANSPWLLCFERWSKNKYHLPRLTLARFKTHIQKHNIQVPKVAYYAVREYDKIVNVRKNHGHTLFHIQCIDVPDPEFKLEVLNFLHYKAIDFVDQPACTLFSTIADLEHASLIVNFLIQQQHTVLTSAAVRQGPFRPCIPKPELTREQTAFIQHVIHPDTHLALLQGGPGTGKSEVGLVWLLSHFAAPLIVTLTGMMVDAGQRRMSGPPGAQVRTEVMCTIHHVIAVSRYVSHAAKWLSKFDLIVMDESSNVDTKLLYGILSSLSTASTTKIVMLGDLGQIHPIGPGCPFSDLVAHFHTSAFQLTENKRVEPGARMLADASAIIRRGTLEGINWNTPALTLNQDSKHLKEAVASFMQSVCFQPKDVLVIQLVTMRNTCRQLLNRLVKEWLIQKGYLYKNRTIKITNQKTLLQCEKIAFKKNTANVRNGELALVLDGKTGKKYPGTMLELEGGKKVHIHGTEGVPPDQIEPGYASTCNKAQGSEWDNVLFYVYPGAGEQPWWSRSYPYVAISRAKKHCTVVSTLKDLEAIVKREQPPRSTILKYLLYCSKKIQLDPQVEIDPNFSIDTTEYQLLHPGISCVPTLDDYAPKKDQTDNEKVFCL